MCGIAGSPFSESGFGLYEENLKRGYYSSSVVCIKPKGFEVVKKLGALHREDVPHGGSYYLFHSRGPTVETTEFNWDDNHPFSFGRFLVAHNGIIENANVLYGGDIGVDSRVIPWLIDRELRKIDTHGKTQNEIADIAIKTALSRLQGTFGLWVFDTTTQIIHIIRSDITLFKDGIEFTSTGSQDRFTVVPQNRIFKLGINSSCMSLGDDIQLTKKPKYFIANPSK